MSIIDKFNANALHVKDEVKSSAVRFVLFLLKLISGLIIGITFALVFQEIGQFGQFSFLFLIVMVTAIFTKLTMTWGFVTLMIFDLICVLLAMLLRMYILIAPG
jgi:hypothetical protein